MKSISLILLAVAMTAFASPNPLEDRQVTCAASGPLCGFTNPVTLTAPAGATVTASVAGILLPISTTLAVDLTTTIGAGCSGAGCTCTTPTNPLPTAVPLTLDLGAIVTFPPPLGIVTLPSVAFTAGIPIPSVNLADVGVCGN